LIHDFSADVDRRIVLIGVALLLWTGLEAKIDGIEGKSVVEEQKLLAQIVKAKIHIGEAFLLQFSFSNIHLSQNEKQSNSHSHFGNSHETIKLDQINWPTLTVGRYHFIDWKQRFWIHYTKLC
jgi:hypothetical protein